MASRIRKQHQDEVRAKIQASQLVNRMHKIAMGEVAADPTQVSAAKALLNKVLPDLKAVEVGGGGENGEIVVKWKS
ncbi:MAG: hypothetical protein VX529_10950 [Pseudomonadota bacterium]|nr:hypothetical protein [Pseudomonadota bacterium]